MRRFNRISLLAFTVALTLTPHAASASSHPHRHVAKCTGSAPCRACKHCRYCKHCAKDGGTCGVCRRRSAAETWREAAARNAEKHHAY